MRSYTLLFLIVCLCSSVSGDPIPRMQQPGGSTPTSIHDPSGRWTIGLDALLLVPQSERGLFQLAEGGEVGQYGIDGEGVGGGLSLRYRLSRRFEIELAAAIVNLDTEFQVEGASGPVVQMDSGPFEIYLTGLEWHLVPDRHWELTVGAFLAQTKLDDVEFLDDQGRSETFTFDDDYGFGLKARIDWPFGERDRWRLTGNVRYLRTILESDSGAGDVNLDPVILSVGIGYRFRR